MKIGGAPQTPAADFSLPSRKSVPRNSLGDFSILLYGREKIGKTSFAAEFEDALFLMFEPGGRDLSIFQKEVADWKMFKGILSSLEKTSQFKTVVVDTADICFKMCQSYVLEKLGIQHESDEDFGKGWTLVKEEFSRQILRLLRLNRGVIFTSHAVEKEIKSRTGAKYDRIMPTMAKQAREILEPIVDIWGYMEYGEKSERILHLRGDSQVAAGHRLQNHFVGIDSVLMGRTAKEAYENFIKAFETSEAVEEGRKEKRLTLRRQ